MSAPLSYYKRTDTTPLVEETLDAFFRRVVQQHADREAVVGVAAGDRLTYASLDVRVEELARGLLGMGVQKGDRVGIWSTNHVEWILLQLATARVGAILVNINPAYRDAELEHALRLAQVQYLFLIPSFQTSAYAEMVSRLCPEAKKTAPRPFYSTNLTDLRQIVVFHPGEPGGRTDTFANWQDVLDAGSGVSPADIQARSETLDCQDPINIQFTSGTTGFPKGVVLTHHNILNNALHTARGLGFSEQDRLCVPVPFYHCFGMVVSNLGSLTQGAAVVIPAEYFDPTATLEAIAQERCTAVHGVPTMFVAELEVQDQTPRDLSSLRTGIMAGAPCPPEIVRRVMEDMGCREILTGFGQTECSPAITFSAPDDAFDKRVETVGTILPHQEIKIIDPGSGETVPVGTSGEVCVRGYHVMKKYYRDEEATRDAISEDGWLHTGDLGTLDAEHYLRITGRLKDMIIRGGENVYPAEVEAFFYHHPDVAEVAVFGLPDAKMGEEVGAWIKLKEGRQANPEDFREFARERMAHYKIPRHVWLVEEFPMTVTGKIQKFKMREMAAQWLKEKE